MTKKAKACKSKDRQPKTPASAETTSAEEFLKSLPPDVADELREIARTSESEEDFCRQVFIGDCPVCGSDNTDDCEDTEIDDTTVGRCLDCKTFWCLECNEVLQKGQAECDHWEVCEQCGMSDADEEGWCGILTWKCDKIEKWRQSRAKRA